MCRVQILSAIGIVPSGAINPTHLRVAGRLSQCATGQVVVRSNITAASAPQSATYGTFGDGFIVVLPITVANLECGDLNSPINVVVECYQNPGCNDTYNGPLQCCDLSIAVVTGIVIPGSLTPSQIAVTGTALGCASAPFILSDPVNVTITFASGARAYSTPVSVDAVNGSFATQIPIPSSITIQCEDIISIDVSCSTNPSCTQSVRRSINCPQCPPRAQVRVVSAGQCIGTPAKQPITPGAIINVPKGVAYFRWDYGDGSMSPVFEIDNTNGTATTPYLIPPTPLSLPVNPAFLPHDYAPGSYNAALVETDQQGKPLECDRIPLTVVASCDQCPNVTLSSSSPGPCVNGKRHVILSTTVNSLPSPTAFQWVFGDGQQGIARPASTVGSWPNPSAPLVNEHDYAPGTYTAELVNILSPNCTGNTVQITVDPCPSVCCPSVEIKLPQMVNQQQQPEVTGCAPSSAVATFNAQLTWPPGCAPAMPSSFDWTLTVPSGKKYQKSTSMPSTDTTAGWTDTGGNPMVVQFGAGGSCSIAVTVQIPGVSTPCNPTDTRPFIVPACCPQLIGPLNASEKAGDPCTWIFSAQVSNPSNAPITFEWTFQDGTKTTTVAPQTEHTYAPGAITTGTTTVTLKSPNCPDQSLSVTVTQTCNCPSISMPAAVVRGCLPGTPSVSLSTAVSPAVPVSFNWSVTAPTGVVFTKTTTAAGTSDSTSDGAWTNTSTGTAGPLDLSQTGAYAVTVRAAGSGVGPACTQPPAKSFSITTCGTSTGPSSSLSCNWWCTLIGIFLIAIPISAYIFTTAHCLLGPAWNVALQGAIIATAIGIFIALCGECCVWIYLIIGSILGVIATLIAAYWLGVPQCWYVALPILLGFLSLGIGMAIDCARRARASSSSSTSSNSNLSKANNPTTSMRIEGSMLAAQAHVQENMEATPDVLLPATNQVDEVHETQVHDESTRLTGLGDLIQKVTQTIGVSSCDPCRERAAKLNQLFPFKNEEG
jgi:hypothetical protein